MNKAKLVGATAVGGGLRYPIIPHLIVGENNNGYSRGEILDANAVAELTSKNNNAGTNGDSVFKYSKNDKSVLIDDQIVNIMLGKNNVTAYYTMNGFDTTMITFGEYNNLNLAYNSVVMGNCIYTDAHNSIINNYAGVIVDVTEYGDSYFSCKKLSNTVLAAVRDRRKIWIVNYYDNTDRSIVLHYSIGDAMVKADFIENPDSFLFLLTDGKKFSEQTLDFIKKTNTIVINLGFNLGGNLLVNGYLLESDSNYGVTLGNKNVNLAGAAMVFGLNNKVLKNAVASFVGGNDCAALSGRNSFAFGDHIETYNIGEASFGSFNKSVKSSISDTKPKDHISGDDRKTATLFSIGNGTSETLRSNAVEVKYNGDTYISGNVNINGNINFTGNTVRIVLRTSVMSRLNAWCYCYHNSYKFDKDFPGLMMFNTVSTGDYKEWTLDLKIAQTGIHAGVLPQKLIFKFDIEPEQFEVNYVHGSIYVV